MYANASQFQLLVGDIGPNHTQLATYDLSIQYPPPQALGISAPANVCAQAPFDVTVTAIDRFGQVVAGYVGVDVGFSRYFLFIFFFLFF
jgi:hypothetical protein